MFEEKLQKFLNANNACLGGITRLQDIGVETLEQAWDKASDEDLIWAVTRPSVMNPEQRRLFFMVVLSSIEGQLTDPRSKNILEKLRTNEVITDEDRAAAWAAARAAAAEGAAWAAAWAAAAEGAAWAAAWAEGAAREWAEAAAEGAAWAAAWVRENFKLCDLNIK